MCVDVFWILTSDAGSTPATSTKIAWIAAVFNLFVEKSGCPKCTHFNNIEKRCPLLYPLFWLFWFDELRKENTMFLSKRKNGIYYIHYETRDGKRTKVSKHQTEKIKKKITKISLSSFKKEFLKHFVYEFIAQEVFQVLKSGNECLCCFRGVYSFWMWLSTGFFLLIIWAFLLMLMNLFWVPSTLQAH